MVNIINRSKISEIRQSLGFSPESDRTLLAQETVEKNLFEILNPAIVAGAFENFALVGFEPNSILLIDLNKMMYPTGESLQMGEADGVPSEWLEPRWSIGQAAERTGVSADTLRYELQRRRDEIDASIATVEEKITKYDRLVGSPR